jgi:hypothetical protein
MSQSSVDLYNKLIKLVQDSQNNINSLVKQKNTITQEAEKDINTLALIYGFDMAQGFFKNNFKKTKEIEDYQNSIVGMNPAELYGGEVVEEYVLPNGETGFAITEYKPASKTQIAIAETGQAAATVLNGLFRLQKAEAGFTGAIAAYSADLVTGGGDTYDFNDYMRDALYDIQEVPLLGGEELGKILNDENELESLYEKPSEYVRFVANMLPFTLKMIRSAKRADIKAAKDLFGRGFLKSTPELRRNISMANTAFKITFADNVIEGEDLGLSTAQATAYGFNKSMATGIAQSIFPDINFVTSSAGKRLLGQFVGNLKNASNKAAISGAVKQFTTGLFSDLGEEEVEFGLDLANKLAFGLALPDYCLEV